MEIHGEIPGDDRVGEGCCIRTSELLKFGKGRRTIRPFLVGWGTKSPSVRGSFLLTSVVVGSNMEL